MTPTPPRVLTVAGTDSGGGAGDMCVDLLHDGAACTELPGPRFASPLWAVPPWWED